MKKFKLAVIGAGLGLFAAAGLPAFAEVTPRNPIVMDAAHPAIHSVAGLFRTGHAAQQAVPRDRDASAVTSTLERGYPGSTDAGPAVRRVDDHHDHGEDHDRGDGGWFGNPFWADGGWGPGWGWGPYGYSTYGYYAVPESGGIHVKVKPKTASVFVDGYYVGVVNDFNGFFQELKLAPGPHRIEIRRKGYAPITFNVKTKPGQTITYKGSMHKLP